MAKQGHTNQVSCLSFCESSLTLCCVDPSIQIAQTKIKYRIGPVSATTSVICQGIVQRNAIYFQIGESVWSFRFAARKELLSIPIIESQQITNLAAREFLGAIRLGSKRLKHVSFELGPFADPFGDMIRNFNGELHGESRVSRSPKE